MSVTTWLDLPPDSGFGLTNLPYGSFAPDGAARRLGVAIGDWVVDLAAAARATAEDFVHLVDAPKLNPLLAAGPDAWSAVRRCATTWLTDPLYESTIRDHLYERASAVMYMPFDVGDYVDFYSSEYHAANVGRILRPGSDPLTPNWRHLPIGYHGRSGSVVVSGTPVRRPLGQRVSPLTNVPEFGASIRLDIEAELGFVIGGSSALGSRVSVAEFPTRVFGAFLLNDWSARDIQAWEYVPLGPFLGKSFATSISPWIVPLEALEAARIGPPPRDPETQPYLRDHDAWGLDISLAIEINGDTVSRPEFRHMYWTPAQQLAHMTVNGAPTRPGDIYGSGTISGPQRETWGCLLELTANGSTPISLSDSTHRGYLNDADTVRISATSSAVGGGRLDFGAVVGTVLPSLAHDI